METSQRLQRDQVRAASTQFLRVRPLIVAAGASANGALLASSNAPRPQVFAVAAVLASAVAFFALESLALRRRHVTESWLLLSLLLTELAISLGSSLTGGMASPLVPVLFAPAVVGLSAFGKSRSAWTIAAIAALGIVLLLLLPPLGSAIPAAQRSAMTAVSLLMTLALVWLGTTGLGEAHGRVVFALDRMRQGVLEEAALRAQEAEALGARVAHELRNPLTAARALVQLVARGELPEKGAERLEVALGEMDRMEATLSDYLSLARPLTDVSPEPVNLTTMLEWAAAVIEARAKDADVQVRVAAREPLVVLADPRRMREALLNLCLNAIAAMPHGGDLLLGVERDGASAKIRVTDQGDGISAEVAARIGEKFVSSSRGGSGLGLLLVNSVARMHGGALRVESEPGKGTRMTIELPCG